MASQPPKKKVALEFDERPFFKVFGCNDLVRLISLFNCPLSNETCVKRGFLNVLKTRKNDDVGHGGWFGLINEAAFRGNLKMLIWLSKHHPEGASEKAMDWAAANGHLEIVIWLTNNRSEGCTKNAMNFSAENGHFETFVWLHYNRKEGCTTWAMDCAAKNGHFEIVLFAYYNRTEGCTTFAMDFTKDARIFKFLEKNTSEGCTTLAKNHAILRGDFPFAIWIVENQNKYLTLESLKND